MLGTPLTDIEPRRVALIKPSSLGDVVHALPVLGAMKRRWPSARFSWVIGRGLKSLVEGHPALDDLIVFERGAMGFRAGGLAAGWRLYRELRRHRFDLAIDLQGLLRSGLMAAATGAKARVGPAEGREGATAFYTHKISTGPPGTHAVDRLLRIASAFGADVSEPEFVLPISDDDRRWAHELCAEVPRPRLVLNPGARWVTKRWPPASFASLARRAALVYRAGVIVVGALEDRSLADSVVAGLGDSVHTLDLCGRTSLMQLAAITEASDVFLSNDTGPLHLAAAAGARVLGIYTCTSPERTGPYGSQARTIRSGIWCAPSYLKRCDRLECFAELTPERVWPALDQALGEVRGVRLPVVSA